MWKAVERTCLYTPEWPSIYVHENQFIIEYFPDSLVHL